MPKTSQKLVVAFGILIGGIFLWLAVRNVDLNSVASSLKNADLKMIFPFLACLATFYWLKALRWSDLLRPTRNIPGRDLVASMMIGFAGNNILPVRLGELLRVFALSNQQDLPKPLVLATIVLERVFDAISILLLLTIAMYATSADTSEYVAARTLLLVGVFVAIIVIAGILAPPSWLQVSARFSVRFLPEQVKDYLIEKFRQVQQGCASLRQAHTLIRVFINSIVQWAFLAACVYIAISAFDILIGPEVAVLILGLVVAGISLPGAPGFIGTIEYCFVLGLGIFGVDASLAISVGIYYHALTFISVTMAGAFFARQYKTSIAQLAIEASNSRSSDK